MCHTINVCLGSSVFYSFYSPLNITLHRTIFLLVFTCFMLCFFSAPSLTLSVFVCCPSAHNTTSSTFIHIEIYISWIFIIVVTRAFIKYVWVRASACWCHISVSVSFHWHSFPQLTLTLPLSLYMCLAHINFSSDMKKKIYIKHLMHTNIGMERMSGRTDEWLVEMAERAIECA